ncbi:MAG TPA: PASTA domain-containing protein [Streptosporangiaceae bacterium]
MPAGRSTAAVAVGAVAFAAAATGIIRALGRQSASPATMPMVVGLPRHAAEAAARSASRTVQVNVRQVRVSCVPAGTVIAQVPVAGSALSRSSRVQLMVCAAAVPDQVDRP